MSRQINRDVKYRLVVTQVREREEQGVSANRYRDYFRSDENVLSWDCAEGWLALSIYLKMFKIVFLKWVNFTICELYLNKDFFFKAKD